MSEEALAAVYRQMAEDQFREAEALKWAEATVRDVADKSDLTNNTA